MAVTLYSISIPVFIRYLNILSKLLKKGEQYATDNSIPHEKLINTSLAEDMQALAFQIQRVSDAAKFVPVRIGGVASVAMEDNETTFDQLQARIQKTIDFLQTVDPKSFEGKDGVEVYIKTGSTELTMTAEDYVLNVAYPNFYFHVTTAYDILRHAGVPVGKLDYLGRR